MRAARQVLQRLEDSLRTAVEGVGRLLPGRLQPLELADELRRAMDQGRTLAPEGTLVANHYRLLLAPADLELFAGLRVELERELTAELREYAAEEGYLHGPGLTVGLEADEKVTAGRAQVEAGFIDQPVAATLSVLAGLAPQTWRVWKETVLGRSDLCQICLEEAAISRRHARLFWTYAGYMIEDLGSSNGTFVGGQPAQHTLLQDGDIIEVGLVQLRFSYDAK
jgi:hypothetical protein